MENNFSHRVLNGFLTQEERAVLLALGAQTVWESGRQGTGYQKASLEGLVPQPLMDKALALLAPYSPLGWDSYLLRYPTGSEIPEHVDPPLAEGLRHVRLNVVLKQAETGGIFFIGGAEVMAAKRLSASRRRTRPRFTEPPSRSTTKIKEGASLVLRECDAVLFWPDQERHCVSRIEAGERLLWSVGCNYEVGDVLER